MLYTSSSAPFRPFSICQIVKTKKKGIKTRATVEALHFYGVTRATKKGIQGVLYLYLATYVFKG